MAQPRILVIGADGYLGSRLLAAVRRTHSDAPGTARRGGPGLARLDLADPDLAGLDTGGADCAAIAAAVTGMRACHDDPAGTRAVNVAGTLALARALAARGVRPLWFSSDMVFPGPGRWADGDRPSPVNAYGEQKAEVESAFAEATGGLGLVVRLSKVYGGEPEGEGLLGATAAALRRGETVRAAADLRFHPTHADDVAACVLRLLALAAETGLSGTFTCCAPAMTRLELLRRVAARVGANPAQVVPVSVDDLGEPFRRPKDVELAVSPLLADHPFRSVDRELDRLSGPAA